MGKRSSAIGKMSMLWDFFWYLRILPRLDGDWTKCKIHGEKKRKKKRMDFEKARKPQKRNWGGNRDERASLAAPWVSSSRDSRSLTLTRGWVFYPAIWRGLSHRERLSRFTNIRAVRSIFHFFQILYIPRNYLNNKKKKMMGKYYLGETLFYSIPNIQIIN